MYLVDNGIFQYHWVSQGINLFIIISNANSNKSCSTQQHSSKRTIMLGSGGYVSIYLNLLQPATTCTDFRTLISKMLLEMVMAGHGRITGPFGSAQNQFHCGRVIPILVCAGAFGEVKREFT